MQPLTKGKLMDAAQATPGMNITTTTTKKVGRGVFGTSLGAPKESIKNTVPSNATTSPAKAPVPKKGFHFSNDQMNNARKPSDFHQLSQHAYNIGAQAHDNAGPNVAAQHKAAHDLHYEAAKAWQSLGTPEGTEHAVKHIVAANGHSQAMKQLPAS